MFKKILMLDFPFILNIHPSPHPPVFLAVCVCLIIFLKPNLKYRIIILVKQVHMLEVESVNFILII